mmetsp:Transcript_48327/g.103534  ORF Transcript_48327/g.103534 Transcript_48327/m.103534 type:complete len:326 (-) Transcript_48327:78-1055(-)|eukprot:CAMPEP_0194755734 /NCGR_PEP_ID=MMETSP0323_2-20130528/9559_1 /TAXON_ID=2866 ORGANISM="Crypthecodinium cohnii, Strain Seligo" /NCGR_SAMPLE_ID=MMETSP0323_2 /ASSEMBLY_ACC=CAM_ASM_000346 /LENGTH=325 /DNA_ID=CAMNT_0039674935 /DNA_START=93 /DNA_END=1070 /DNA_ORIENTATION=+
MRFFVVWVALLVPDVAAVEHFHFNLGNLRHHRHPARSGSSSNSVLASLGGGPGLPPELSQVLEESKRRLSLVEAQQEKAVEKARSKLGDALNKEASKLETALLAQSKNLQTATKSIEQVVKESREALSAEDSSKNSNSWNGSAVEAQARLSAKISLLESFAKRSERSSKRAGEEALRRAKAVLEDGAFPLNRKLGDLSPLLQEAEKTLVLDDTEESNLKSSSSSSSAASLLVKNNSGEKKAQTLSAEALEEVKKQATAQADEAGKAFKATLEASQKTLKTQVEAIKTALEAAEREEMSTVHAAGAASEKLKALAAHKHKVVPAKK